MNNAILFIICYAGMSFSIAMIVSLIIIRRKQKSREASIEAIFASLRKFRKDE